MDEQSDVERGGPPYLSLLVLADASAPICTIFLAGSSRRRLHILADLHSSQREDWNVSLLFAASLHPTLVLSAVLPTPQSEQGDPVPRGGREEERRERRRRCLPSIRVLERGEG